MKGPESRTTLRLLNALRKAKRPVWKRTAQLLSKPRRRRIEVSLGRLDRLTQSGEKVVVPGKLLASGAINHPLSLGYFAASRKALDQLKGTEVVALPLDLFLKQYAQEKGIRIII